MTTARTDAENKRIVDSLLPGYERLKADRIRAEHEVERLTADLAQAEAEAMSVFETTDERQIAEKIAEAQAENSQVVDEFSRLVHDVQASLQRLSTGQAA